VRVSRNRVAILLIAVFAIVGTVGTAATQPTSMRSISDSLPLGGSAFLSGWKTIWSDGFAGPAGTGVSSQWTYETGTGIFGTGEVETMTSSTANVHLDGAGNLAITAIRTGTSWTSGRIQTVQRFTPPPGKETMISAVIEQPDPASAAGYWPAFWMLAPAPWPQSGEIDILEDVDGLSEHSGTLHCGTLTGLNADGTYGPCHEKGGLTSGLLPCATCQTAYHMYSVVIDRRSNADQQISWYLDGTQFWSVSEQQVGAAWIQAVDHGFNVVLDLAIGGPWTRGQCHCNAPGSLTSSGGTMSISGVGVYEK
jgi:beta-glucanase (GH16 family)